MTIAINIGKGGTGRELALARGVARIHFFKVPIAKIAVEAIAALEITKINILPTIAVDISDGHPGTVMSHSIGGIGVALKRVGKPDSGLLGIHQCEPWLASHFRMDLRTSKTRAHGPRQWGCSRTVRPQQKRCSANS